MSAFRTLQVFVGGLTAVALAVGALVANAATITRDDHYPFYGPGLVQYVASKGTFPAVIIANPFGAGSDAALLDNIELPGNFPPAPFAATTPQGRDDGHLVMVFDPVAAASGHGACAAPAKQTAGKAGGASATLRLQIAFCYDTEVVSEAFMEMPRPSGPSDQAFTQAMAQLLSVLLPSESPNKGDCPDTVANC